jgi:hypothetical protein
MTPARLANDTQQLETGAHAGVAAQDFHLRSLRHHRRRWGCRSAAIPIWTFLQNV